MGGLLLDDVVVALEMERLLLKHIGCPIEHVGALDISRSL
jgi:hypothetical protein